MTHRVAGRKLGRTTNQRKSLFRNLANQLILHEKIETTEAKAKAIRPMVEKLVTRAKENTIHNRRELLKSLASENTVRKMLEVIGPKFKNRAGGYTRIIRLGSRVGDRASLVALTFVEEVSQLTPEVKVVEKPSTVEVGKKEKEIEEKTKRVVKKPVSKKTKTLKEKDGNKDKGK